MPSVLDFHTNTCTFDIYFVEAFFGARYRFCYSTYIRAAVYITWDSSFVSRETLGAFRCFCSRKNVIKKFTIIPKFAWPSFDRLGFFFGTRGHLAPAFCSKLYNTLMLRVYWYTTNIGDAGNRGNRSIGWLCTVALEEKC